MTMEVQLPPPGTKPFPKHVKCTSSAVWDFFQPTLCHTRSEDRLQSPGLAICNLLGVLNLKHFYLNPFDTTVSDGCRPFKVHISEGASVQNRFVCTTLHEWITCNFVHCHLSSEMIQVIYTYKHSFGMQVESKWGKIFSWFTSFLPFVPTQNYSQTYEPTLWRSKHMWAPTRLIC